MALTVFISYAKEDQESALRYYEALANEGVSPWMDVKKLLPGQNWEAEIERAFSDANLIVLLLSKKSVSKRGFVQKEANDAIERLRLKQPTDIYVIPLLLEPCEVPEYISKRLQYVELGAPESWNQVRESLRLAASQQSIELELGVVAGPFRVLSEQIQEKVDGTPGHDISIKYPKFESATKPAIAKELSAFFAGRAYKVLIEERQRPWDQSPELFPLGTEGAAMNGRWDNFGIVHANERMIGLTYRVGWYGAGAAHPNSHFETFNFACNDSLYPLRLQDYFVDFQKATQAISKVCQRELAKEYRLRTGSEPDAYQLKSFSEGASLDPSNFTSFTVGVDHFTFLFAPYQVSSYAMGAWSVKVYFNELSGELLPSGPHLLANPA